MRKNNSSPQCTNVSSPFKIKERVTEREWLVNTWRSLSSFSVIKELIWKTKPNIAIAKKKVGPIVPTAEKISNAGWANSFRLTTQLYSGSERIWHQGTSDVLDTYTCEGIKVQHMWCISTRQITTQNEIMFNTSNQRPWNFTFCSNLKWNLKLECRILEIPSFSSWRRISLYTISYYSSTSLFKVKSSRTTHGITEKPFVHINAASKGFDLPRQGMKELSLS